MKRIINAIINRLGFEFIRHDMNSLFPRDFTEEEIEIIRPCRPYTMTSNERIYSLIHSVNYIVKHNIPGAIVECGVWKGGSMMAAIKALSLTGNHRTKPDLIIFT